MAGTQKHKNTETFYYKRKTFLTSMDKISKPSKSEGVYYEDE